MGVDVIKPQTSMGRRLFGMAAPLIGGAFGGAGGAAAGSLIGSRVAGASPGDALLNAAQTGIQSKESATARRLAQAKQSPQMAIKEGLDAAATMDPNDPLRKTYEETLVRAQMMADNKPKYGLGVNTNLMAR